MKILLTGATGSIGSEVLEQCLAHPAITSVVAFSRRELSGGVSSNPKLQVVIKKDFLGWTQEELEPHADAVAMAWMMGSYTLDEDVHVNYPLAFQQAFLKVLKTRPGATFRDIHLSGILVTQDQDKSRWFMGTHRKLKGRFETKALAFAEENSDVWKTFIVKPAAVVTRKTWGGWLFTTLLGDALSIKAGELGAFVAQLAVAKDGESGLISNAKMAVEGREVLGDIRKGASNGSG